jgi:hypothetical protein
VCFSEGTWGARSSEQQADNARLLKPTFIGDIDVESSRLGGPNQQKRSNSEVWLLEDEDFVGDGTRAAGGFCLLMIELIEEAVDLIIALFVCFCFLALTGPASPPRLLLLDPALLGISTSVAAALLGYAREDPAA